MNFQRCLSCGKYFEVSDNAKDVKYCSPECFREFIRCSVCGNFFEKTPGSIKDDELFVCSEECMKKYKFDRLTRQLSIE